MSVKVSASPQAVRAWAESVDAIPKGQRGRLGADTIAAYNATHGLKHVEKGFVKTKKVSAKPTKGRTVTRTVVVSEVRKAAVAAGVFSGKRGRLPKAIFDAYVLGTLDTKLPYLF